MLSPDPVGSRIQGAQPRLDAPAFEVAPELRASTLTVGREEHPLVVIDGSLDSARGLVDFAASQAQFTRSQSEANHYPGVRAPVPQAYIGSLYQAIRPYMTDVFGFPAAGPIKADCYLSLATSSPEQLNVWQRGAHFDSVERDYLAVLHYLCDPSHGGTAFYRHRATGFESITAERAAIYLDALQLDLEAHGPPPARYLTESDARFEQVASIEAVFNRVIVYRGRMLHSGSVNAARLSADPRTGRLTANAFFYMSKRGTA